MRKVFELSAEETLSAVANYLREKGKLSTGKLLNVTGEIEPFKKEWIFVFKAEESK